MIDKKEKMFFQEVENLKSEFDEEKQKESINKLSKEGEKAIHENPKLSDQILECRTIWWQELLTHCFSVCLGWKSDYIGINP